MSLYYPCGNEKIGLPSSEITTSRKCAVICLNYSGVAFSDPENPNSTPEASSPSSPLSDEECTQGVMENTPYGCRYCQKAFPRSYMLTRHEQVS